MTGLSDDDPDLMIQEANRLLDELESSACQPLSPNRELEPSTPAYMELPSLDGSSLLVEAQERMVKRNQGLSFSNIFVLVAIGTGAVVYGGLSILEGLYEPPSFRPEVIQPPRQESDSGHGYQRNPA